MSENAKTRYTISKSGGPLIPDYKIPSNQSVADNMAGIAIVGSTLYCAKRSSTGSAIYIGRNISSSTESLSPTVTINYAVHGMTYCKKYLYMTCYKNTIIKMPVSGLKNGTIEESFTVTVDGKGYIPQSIAYYGTYNGEDMFIVGVEKMQKNNCFFYMIGVLSGGKFIEKKRFYTTNSGGYEQSQDICYHSKYGLFIVTNKKANDAFTNYNMILCARIPSSLNSIENGTTYNPYAEFRFNGNAETYSKLAVKSLYISGDGNLYLSTNATSASSKTVSDRIFRAVNPVFKSNGILEVNLISKQSVKVPNLEVTINGLSYICENFGAFALDKTTGYCLLSHTTDDAMKNKASILLSSPDFTSTDFTRISGSPVLTTMGHGNGMTYANGYLFVAAYDKSTSSRRAEITKLDPANGKVVDTYKCEHSMGGISYYGKDPTSEKDLFIVVNYDDINNKPYALEPEFYIGYLESGKFISTKKFSVQNPSFDSGSQKNYLQDIYYSPDHGLFYVTFTGTTKIYRILPEQILQASDVALAPVAVYIKDASINEIESLAVNDSGVLYIAQNCRKNVGYDAVTQISSLSFISK